jgi:hypothetical protein
MVAISDVFENLVEKHFNFRIRHIPTPRARLLHATGQSYHAPHSSKKKVKSSGPCFFPTRATARGGSGGIVEALIRGQATRR